jgi:soluble lytic murein transglycosylase-like protein
MWQFMPETARAYGLTVGPLVGRRLPDPRDERHDFERATTAAARYLKDIYSTDAQASGLLVVAAYNWGQTRVLRLIRSLPETPRDRNYWRLLTTYRDQIPDETSNYVLAVVSAATIGDRPDLFGFAFDPPLEPAPHSVRPVTTP